MSLRTRIYTDGGCTGNPGPGGWAAVILCPDDEPLEISGGDSSTTNNRMELTAVIEALGRIEGAGQAVEVLTDSKYVQKGISQWMPGWIAKNWRTAGGSPVKNQDLWKALKGLDDRMTITWTWVKGHAGRKWNERCDYLVGRERAKYAGKRAVPSRDKRETARCSEPELESALIDRLKDYLLGLERGFLFEARKKRFTFENRQFCADLVLYNRFLRCYVLIDLKIGDLEHQDIGRMRMFMSGFDRYVKLKDEQPAAGIILRRTKNGFTAEIILPEGARIHAAEYERYLPDKETLKRRLEEARGERKAARGRGL